MDTYGNFVFVNLDVSDVPGAKLPYSLVENHTVVQLKRWLKCRELKTTGNREELIKRVKQCIAAGNDHVIPVSVDGGKWYNLKLEKLQCEKSQKRQEIKQTKPAPALLPISGWGSFPSDQLPQHFNQGHIHHHIVESVQFLDKVHDDSDNEDTVEDLHTAKPLKKGQQYFQSGHVMHMKDCVKNANYFLKAKVMASYNIDTLYDTTVQISKGSGFIKDASCTCVASSMGRCNHVCALLFALEDFINKNGSSLQSCTSQLCEWNKGRKKQKNPKRVSDTNYNGEKKRKVDSIISYDPTPTFKPRSPDQTVNDFLNSIQSAHDSCTETPSSMWESLLKRQYQDYPLTDSIQKNIKDQSQCILKHLTVPECESPHELISKQGSSEWYLQRRMRVTASVSKTIANIAKPQSVCNLLDKLLWKSDNVQTKAMMYGNENEAKALNDYKQICENQIDGYTVTKTGFWVNSKYPEIGCSPDGIVTDPSEEPQNVCGLVEIKCPMSLQGKDVKLFDELLTRKQLHGFCLEKCEGEIKLKTQHPYYYQIQTQLGVMGLQWCDLVVWSNASVVVVRVRFDKGFWSTLSKKLVAFHHKWLCTELVEMRIPRGLLPFSLGQE